MNLHAAPEGFEPSARTGPFLDLIGPVFTRDDERGTLIGLRVEGKHLNARGRVHGAVVSGLADVALGRNIAAAAGPETQPITVSLQVQFVGAAGDGEWLEATAVVRRIGRTTAFVDGSVHAGERLVATATAVFAMAKTG